MLIERHFPKRGVLMSVPLGGLTSGGSLREDGEGDAVSLGLARSSFCGAELGFPLSAAAGCSRGASFGGDAAAGTSAGFSIAVGPGSICAGTKLALGPSTRVGFR